MVKAWVHQCRHCGKPIYFFYEGWHHEHKKGSPFPWPCSDDPEERYGGPQADPVEGEAVKSWFCNSTLAPKCRKDMPDPMGLGGHDSCQWVYLIPAGGNHVAS